MTKARDIASATTPNANAALLATFPHRNLIINGAMQVAQRGTSFTGTGYTLDRWYGLSGRTTTQDPDVPSDEFLYSLKCVSSGNAPRIFGSVELSSTGSEHPIRSSTDYTLSGWVKGTSGESFNCRVAFANGVGQGDYRQITLSTLTTLDGSWQHFIATFNSGSNIVGASDNCVELYFNISTHDTTFQITGVQLEVGDTATPFEHRSFGEELARCQRYYCRSYNIGTDTGTNTLDGSITTRQGGTPSTNNVAFNVDFPVTMRAAPTITLYAKDGTSGKVSDFGNSYSGNGTDRTVSAVNAIGMRGFGGGNFTGVSENDIVIFHYEASSEI
jgi:hypothetical protein